MNYDQYTNLRFTEDYHLFLFYSEGPKGRITKLVGYFPMDDLPDSYNLSFGTVKINQDGDEYLDGDEISDNGDRDKILATIASTAFRFTDKYPDSSIYFSGSNKIRTRLYQMAINHAYDELSERFSIFGDISSDLDTHDFQNFVSGTNYTGFLVKKK